MSRAITSSYLSWLLIQLKCSPSLCIHNFSLLSHLLWFSLIMSRIALSNTINWRDTTHFDSEDYYRTGCRNVSHCQQQQSYSVYSGLRLPGRSYSSYLWKISVLAKFYWNFGKIKSKGNCLQKCIEETANIARITTRISFVSLIIVLLPTYNIT